MEPAASASTRNLLEMQILRPCPHATESEVLGLVPASGGLCFFLIFFERYIHSEIFDSFQFSSVSLSCLTLCETMDCSMPGFPLKLMSIESVRPSNHLILCHPLLLPSIPPSIRVFSNESVLHFRWPKYWSFSFNISPSNEHSGLISFRKSGLTSLQFKGLSSFLHTTVQKHQFFSTQLSL